MFHKNTTTQLSLLTVLSLGLAQSATAGDGWNSANDSLVSQSQLEAEMGACGFMDDLDEKAEKDALYTRCLQVNHPRHHGNNHARWGARGTICTELVNNHDAPVSYNPTVATETDTVLKDNDCIAKGAKADALVSQSQLEGEMGACGFMDDLDQKAEKDAMYSRCLQVNHPRHHGNNHARWGARGTICSLLVNKYDAPVSYNPYVATETDTVLKDNDCIAKGAKADASPDYCAEWKTAPATTACKGEGGTLAAGSYVKNGNGLWQCRDGEKDQWGHTVTWVADKAQLDNDCNTAGDQQDLFEAQMDACDFLSDPTEDDKMYSRCVALNSAEFHQGGETLRGDSETICTELVTEMEVTSTYSQSYFDEAVTQLRNSSAECVDVGTKRWEDHQKVDRQSVECAVSASTVTAGTDFVGAESCFAVEKDYATKRVSSAQECMDECASIQACEGISYAPNDCRVHTIETNDIELEPSTTAVYYSRTSRTPSGASDSGPKAPPTVPPTVDALTGINEYGQPKSEVMGMVSPPQSTEKVNFANLNNKNIERKGDKVRYEFIHADMKQNYVGPKVYRSPTDSFFTPAGMMKNSWGSSSVRPATVSRSTKSLSELDATKTSWTIEYDKGENLDPGDTVHLKAQCDATVQELNPSRSKWLTNLAMVLKSEGCPSGYQPIERPVVNTDQSDGGIGWYGFFQMCQELKPIGHGTPISGFKYAYNESCPSGYQAVPGGIDSSVHYAHNGMKACYTRDSNLAPLRGMAVTYVNNNDEWYGNLPGGERIWGTGGYNGDLREGADGWDLYLHAFRLATCDGVDERYLNLHSTGKGLVFTKAKGAGWTIHAQNDEWNPNEHGLNVNLARDGKYLDFTTSDGTSTKKHDFKLFWDVQIKNAPRREVIDLYELREATVALKNNVRTFKGHTDNAKDVLTTVNTLADDVAQARDTIRSINRTLKIVGAFHPLTKKLATAVRSTLTSIDKGISGLDTTLKTVTKVTGELEPPMETASTWLGNVGSTSTVLYNGTSTAMERKVGLDNDNACGAILDWMPPVAINGMTTVVDETASVFGDANSTLEHEETLQAVLKASETLAALNGSSEAATLRKLSNNIAKLQSDLDAIAGPMNAIKVVVDNPVGEAIGFLASLIPVDELLAPLTAPLEAMITDLFPGTKIVGTLAEYLGDVDQIKTKLDTMKEKLADLKTHYEELSPKKIAEQKMKHSKAAGVEALKTKVEEYVRQKGQDLYATCLPPQE